MHERLAAERRLLTGPASHVDARIPGPADERVLAQMMDELREGHAAPLRIGERAADLAVAERLPLHSHGRESPGRIARNAGPRVGVAVTGVAPQRRRSVAIGPAHNIHDVTVTIVV